MHNFFNKIISVSIRKDRFLIVEPLRKTKNLLLEKNFKSMLSNRNQFMRELKRSIIEVLLTPEVKKLWIPKRFQDLFYKILDIREIQIHCVDNQNIIIDCLKVDFEYCVKATGKAKKSWYEVKIKNLINEPKKGMFSFFRKKKMDMNIIHTGIFGLFQEKDKISYREYLKSRNLERKLYHNILMDFISFFASKTDFLGNKNSFRQGANKAGKTLFPENEVMDLIVKDQFIYELYKSGKPAQILSGLIKYFFTRVPQIPLEFSSGLNKEKDFRNNKVAVRNYILQYRDTIPKENRKLLYAFFQLSKKLISTQTNLGETKNGMVTDFYRFAGMNSVNLMELKVDNGNVKDIFIPLINPIIELFMREPDLISPNS